MQVMTQGPQLWGGVDPRDDGGCMVAFVSSFPVIVYMVIGVVQPDREKIVGFWLKA